MAHRRLAIIDLSDRAAQPMHSADGRYTIVFNGEIYNFRALRAELVAAGHWFASESDTEVLLQLYATHGAEMVHRLRGMFAFAIWDSVARGVFLARDTFGIKPLYYADDGRTLHFASEVKALLRGGGIDTSPEPAGHAGFFLWGHVPEPYTMYRGIRALPAGSTMWCGPDSAPCVTERTSVRGLLMSAEECGGAEAGVPAHEQLHAALRDSVEHHLVADVDVGIFLSAGIDSTVLAALVSETGVRPRTVTLGFREFAGTRGDETPLAELVARQYDCDHRTVWITRDDFERELPRLLDRMDQPSTDGVNTYFVARAAADHGMKVALSGLGGDELFGGYPSFAQLPSAVGILSRMPLPPGVGRAVRQLAAPALGRVTSPKYAGMLEYGGDLAGAYLLRRCLYAPWEIAGIIGEDMAREGLRQLDTRAALARSTEGLSLDHHRVSVLETQWYMRNQLLRDTDWAGMSHSLEIRVPLTDTTLWSAVAPMLEADRSGKRWLAMAPKRPLPDAVATRPKTGFTTPVGSWVGSGSAGPRTRGLRGWARRVYAGGERLP